MPRRFKESLRLYALPVTHDGERVGTVVAGVSLAPYDETATIALVGSLGLAVLLLAAVALLSHWILGKALLPVSRMTDDAADWSEHDLDRRFDRGEPYDELTRLAATLDALLERLVGEPAPRAAAHRRALPRAADAAREDRRRERARAPPGADQRGLPRQPRGGAAERRADDPHRRGAGGGRPPGGRPEQRRRATHATACGRPSRRCTARPRRAGIETGVRLAVQPRVTVAIEPDSARADRSAAARQRRFAMAARDWPSS